MKISEQILHSARLNNNCPECYTTDGLEISFIQEEVGNRFYSKTQKQIHDTLYCQSCKTTIYPVNWTEDIDRVYKYHKKQAIPKSTQLHLKPITYSLIFLGLGIVAVLLYFLEQLS
jgi:hypothetical protein